MIMNLHQHAITIEHNVRGLLGKGTERYALGGIADADFIECGGMLTAIAAGLSAHYKDANMEEIDKFLAKLTEYNGVYLKDIDEDELIKIIDELGDLSKRILKGK
jgi:hypothetical protein